MFLIFRQGKVGHALSITTNREHLVSHGFYIGYNLPMLTVGNLLKKAREHSGKQIEEIAQIIRIKPDYLEKIEQNDFTSFNSSTFVKGFIRSYASFLGLDAENIVALFRRQIGEEDVPLKAKKTLVRQQSVVVSPSTIISIAIIVFFVGLFGFLLSQFYKLQQPPELGLVQPTDPITTVETSTYQIKGYTEENTQISVNSSPVQLTSENTFTLSVDLKEGDNTFTFDAWKKNIDGKHATKIVTILYVPKGKPNVSPTTPSSTSTTTTPTSGKEITVVLQLTDQAWIQVVADNTQKAVGIKDKGYSLTFKATKNIDITTGRTTASTVKINDKQFPWRTKNGIGYLTCAYNADISDWKCE